MSMDVKAIIETTLKAEIVKALNAAPDAIEKLVTAAIAVQVGRHSGSTERGYYGDKVGYLDYLIGTEIRRAAEEAVREVFAAQKDVIKEAVKRKFSADDMVESFANALCAVGSQDWTIKVSFEGEKK
jgi:RNA binding exosome subunit